MKPTIAISYYAMEEPKVELPDALKESVEIHFVDLMEKDFLVLEHGRVTVYRTYKDEHQGAVEEWSDHWLSTEVWTDWENDICFDSRVLPAVPAEDLLRYQALYPDSPLKQSLAYSIDKGFITQEGYDNHG
jgi:hypothetical protein